VTWGRLHAFLAVYELGSVRAASEALHVTPAAVSASIKYLESALDVGLFVKAGRGIVPTDSAQTLAGYARRLLGLVEEASQAVHEAGRGRVRIGAVATASEFVLPRFMASFVAAHPHIEVSMSVAPRAELFASARDHALDVVVAGRPPSGAGLVTRAERPNQLVVVSGPGPVLDPLTSTWLLTGSGSGTRDTALGMLAELQAEPPLLTLGTAGAVIAAAREGLGVTLVHQDAARPHLKAGALRVQPMPGTPLQRPWHLSTGSEPTRSTGSFVAHVCDTEIWGDAAFRRRGLPPVSRRGRR
jgi:DNA-binding transcriptional LysR family regulator